MHTDVTRCQSSSKRCRSFRRDIANGQESRRNHRARANSAYYCQHVLSDGLSTDDRTRRQQLTLQQDGVLQHALRPAVHILNTLFGFNITLVASFVTAVDN